MNERQRQEFGWALRQEGFTFSFAQFDTLCRVIADLVEAEYERGFDEGCQELNSHALDEDQL